MTQHKDQLIEDALALLKDAVRVEPFQTQNTLPPAQFSSTETNVVVATHPNGSVVAPSSVVIVSIDDSEPPNAAPPEVENQGASSSKETEHPHADLVEQTLSLMQTTAEQQKIAVSPAEGLPPRLPSPKSWLDTERAIIKSRVETFTATQSRFQHDRAEYCDAALAAAVACEWKPSSQQ